MRGSTCGVRTLSTLLVGYMISHITEIVVCSAHVLGNMISVNDTNKNRICCHRVSQAWPLFNWNSSFARKRNIYLWREHPQRVANANALQLHKHSRPSPENQSAWGGCRRSHNHSPTTCPLDSIAGCGSGLVLPEGPFTSCCISWQSVNTANYLSRWVLLC